jgi:hypothetical protein
MRRTKWAVFMAGCLALAAAFVFYYGDWADRAFRSTAVLYLIAAVAAMMLVLIVISILSKGEDRWRAAVLAALLLLGLALLDFFVIGWMVLLPTAFILLYLFGRLRREKGRREQMDRPD